MFYIFYMGQRMTFVPRNLADIPKMHIICNMARPTDSTSTITATCHSLVADQPVSKLKSP